MANVVDGVLRACHAPDASGEVINVATGGRISLNQLFATVKREVGSTLEPIYSDPRAGDVRDSQADIGKAQRLLGYTPMRQLRRGAGTDGGVVSGVDGSHGRERPETPRPGDVTSIGPPRNRMSSRADRVFTEYWSRSPDMAVAIRTV